MKYDINEPVSGVVGDKVFSYKAGTVEAKDEAETLVLEHLVRSGVAKRAEKGGKK